MAFPPIHVDTELIKILIFFFVFHKADRRGGRGSEENIFHIDFSTTNFFISFCFSFFFCFFIDNVDDNRMGVNEKEL